MPSRPSVHPSSTTPPMAATHAPRIRPIRIGEGPRYDNPDGPSRTALVAIGTGRRRGRRWARRRHRGTGGPERAARSGIARDFAHGQRGVVQYMPCARWAGRALRRPGTAPEACGPRRPRALPAPGDDPAALRCSSVGCARHPPSSRLEPRAPRSARRRARPATSRPARGGPGAACAGRCIPRVCRCSSVGCARHPPSSRLEPRAPRSARRRARPATSRPRLPSALPLRAEVARRQPS